MKTQFSRLLQLPTTGPDTPPLAIDPIPGATGAALAELLTHLTRRDGQTRADITTHLRHIHHFHREQKDTDDALTRRLR